MRIVAIGDTHTQHQDVKVPAGDVLLFAGDGEFCSAMDLIEFDRWLYTLDHKHKIVVAGNHDFFCERHPEAQGLLTQAVYLREEQYNLPNGITVWGSPMTNRFMDWAFMDSEENLDRYYWSKIPKNTDILLVHGPAYKHLDIGRPRSDHLGSRTLAQRIDELKIPYVVHGHIHGSYGIKKTEYTTYINCSVLDEEYDLVNQPIVFDI